MGGEAGGKFVLRGNRKLETGRTCKDVAFTPEKKSINSNTTFTYT